MRKMMVLAAGLLTAGAWASAFAAQETYKATLNGASEVPPVQSSATGAATVNVDTASKKVSWSVTYTGLTAAAAHIHCGAAAGANAGVAVPLTVGPSPIAGTGTMTDAQLADLQAGKCYVNIHTAANKGGEIRGQLAK
ncbi:MAG TPA: CHRD domain-containing protein [Stellaceae bacterium]